MIETIVKILEHEAPSPQAMLRPCLVGKTGAGKTSRVFQISKILGKKMVHLQLSGRLPEDIGGIPKVVRGQTEWSIPDWAVQAMKEPCLLFIDEADKAPRECMEVILTLLAENRLREHHLHPETDIILAMQPVEPEEFLCDETGEALAARLMFIPIEYDWEWLGNKWGVNLSGLPKKNVDNLPILPDPSPRQIDWALSWVTKNPDEWHVLNYFLQTDIVAYLQESMNSVALTGGDIAKTINRNPELLKSLKLSELIDISPDIFEHCSSEVVGEMLYRIWTEGNEEDASKTLEHVFKELKSRCEQNGGTLEIVGGDSEEKFIEVFNNTLNRIAATWIEQNKKKKASNE